jgi:hypothetical protein
LLVNRQQVHKRTTGNYIMRINELLVESQQLDEGPFGQAVGKAVGGVAKGIGAVAGGIAGIPGAVKKGFKAGKAAVQGDPAADTTAAPADPAATTTAPTQAAPVQKAAPAATSGVKQGLTKAFAAPAATTSAPAATTSAAPAADATPAPAADATPAANPEAEKAAKIGVGQINKIIPTLRTRDLMSLQANLEKTIASKKKAAPAPAATTAPAAPPADAAPAAAATTTSPAATPATTPAAPGTDAAKDELYGAGNRPKGAKDKVAALKSQNKKKAVAPTQAEIDADRERNIGITSDSVIRTKSSLSETLARKVQEQKQRMYETALMAGTQSVFKK